MMPSRILLYVRKDDPTMFVVATDISQIPENCCDGVVGVYNLVGEQSLIVKRELKPKLEPQPQSKLKLSPQAQPPY